MLVVIGTRIPRRLKGILQLWLLEPKSGVYVGNINKKIESKLYKLLVEFCNSNSGIIVMRSDSSNIQGFTVYCKGDNSREIKYKDGLYLSGRYYK